MPRSQLGIIRLSVLKKIKYKEETLSIGYQLLNFLRNPIIAYRNKIGDPIATLNKYYY